MVWLMILLTVREYIIPRGGYPDVQGGDVITGLYKRAPTVSSNQYSSLSYCGAMSWDYKCHFLDLWKDIVSPATVLSTSESSVIIITSRVSFLAPAFLVSIFFSTICIALPN